MVPSKTAIFFFSNNVICCLFSEFLESESKLLHFPHLKFFGICIMNRVTVATCPKQCLIYQELTCNSLLTDLTYIPCIKNSNEAKKKTWLTIYYVLSRSTCTPGLFCHPVLFSLMVSTSTFKSILLPHIILRKCLSKSRMIQSARDALGS